VLYFLEEKEKRRTAQENPTYSVVADAKKNKRNTFSLRSWATKKRRGGGWQVARAKEDDNTLQYIRGHAKEKKREGGRWNTNLFFHRKKKGKEEEVLEGESFPAVVVERGGGRDPSLGLYHHQLPGGKEKEGRGGT